MRLFEQKGTSNGSVDIVDIVANCFLMRRLIGPLNFQQLMESLNLLEVLISYSHETLEFTFFLKGETAFRKINRSLVAKKNIKGNISKASNMIKVCFKRISERATLDNKTKIKRSA